MSIISKLAARWIQRYQSAGGGARLFNVECNFDPTCSEYTRQCIERFGFCHGVVLGWRRLKRCRNRDLTDSISDPVPQSRQLRS